MYVIKKKLSKYFKAHCCIRANAQSKLQIKTYEFDVALIHKNFNWIKTKITFFKSLSSNDIR